MLIQTTSVVPFPRSLVYVTFRDRLVELVPYLPQVRSITVKSRREEGAQVHSTNEWQGTGEIPPLLRPWLSDDLLKWTEYNIWNNTEFTLQWRIETHAFSKAFHYAGENLFLEEDGQTIIESQGQLWVEPQQLQGIPSPLRNKVAQMAEKFLGKRMEPNQLQIAEGVCHYLGQAV
jgi:hypothetical protein